MQLSGSHHDLQLQMGRPRLPWRTAFARLLKPGNMYSRGTVHQRAVVYALAVLAVGWVASCGETNTTPTVPDTPNRAPVAQGSIPDQVITAGQSATVNVASSFSDPDGDPLTYEAASSNAGVAGVAASGATVTIGAVAAGAATVTVTARDPGGLTAAQSVNVTVRLANRGPVAAGSMGGAFITHARSEDSANEFTTLDDTAAPRGKSRPHLSAVRGRWGQDVPVSAHIPVRVWRICRRFGCVLAATEMRLL